MTDETGKPVPDAAVSFHIPEDGPGGAFLNGLRTSVATTDLRGRASAYGFQANRLPGRFLLRILVSKEQVRAGIVSFQYVAELTRREAPVSARPGPTAPPARPRARSKWLAILALAGGAAAAGAIAAGRAGRDSTAPTAITAPPGPIIGSPSISVGRP